MDLYVTGIVEGEDGSATVKALSNSVRGGVGFHHAGLTSSQRKVIENGFRNGISVYSRNSNSSTRSKLTSESGCCQRYQKMEHNCIEEHAPASNGGEADDGKGRKAWF